MSYPPIPPVQIFIAGQLLRGWTHMDLSREKENMTGNLTVKIFYPFVPTTPQIRGAAPGAEVHVYIGGHLAFTGTLDARTGKGQDGKAAKGKGGGGGGRARDARGRFIKGGQSGPISNIGPNQYLITLNARGKTKNTISSSQEHKTGQINSAKTKPVVEELVKPYKVVLDWQAPVHDMDKIRFRDGALVINEINRVCAEYGYFRYEDRFGRLRVTDKTHGTGEPLILGRNIIDFEAKQAEDKSNSPIKVKGQRTRKNVRGRKAIDREYVARDSNVKAHRPLTIQHYTDASDEALRRRAQHEVNMRLSAAKKLDITVFHVMPESGEPWDIGQLHYVEVPPEGIAGMFECTGLSYTVDDDKKLVTRLTLNPPTKQKDGAGTQSGAALAAIAETPGGISSAARLAQLGIELIDGQYPDAWVAPDLVEIASDSFALDVGGPALADIVGLPPAKLPTNFT